MDLKELNKLAKLCKKHGIKSLKMAGVELEFDLHFTEESEVEQPPVVAEDSEEPQYDEEALLTWSSGNA